ncbi:hypothetical protein HW115_04380 [Verrucomicrobiaceae bacterium N1E253]|uniref:Uncharacterized protein n=1 Tax=Oceaniferula marina TaxID=2748318 RepID=A0A851GD17_9BACT|nr:hypothetical protein [Oceaniferula marina]NWK54832.1 hypothetical protein [Oceaniferula marina]
MNERNLYLPLVPESLVASMLSPEEFGAYLAVGSTSHYRGQAIFFEVDPSFKSDHFPMQLIEEQCVPHADGRPKNSLYLSIYRVLEHVPVSALGNLHLATDDGRVLTLEKQTYEPEADRQLHLYQEFGPVHPTVASTLNAVDFCKKVTSPDAAVQLPRVVFSELILRDFATDPEHGRIGELPYNHIDHLRSGLMELAGQDEKQNKIIFRRIQRDFFFRTIRNGFFVGDQNEMSYYPMPSQESLNSEHYDWWRSAQTTHL